MTESDFKELKYIKKEIKMLEAEIKELHNTLKSPTLGSTSQKCSVSDTVAKTVEKVDAKERMLKKALLRCRQKETEILRFIEAVGNSRMRLILKYRYIDGFSWVQIAVRMSASVASVKMAYYRYIERREDGGKKKRKTA